MFEILYLIGPGALTWLVMFRLKRQKKKDKKIELCFNFLQAIIEIMAYSMVNMTLTVSILKPLDRVGFVVLADGRMNLQYGASGLCISIIVAVVMGVADCYFSHVD